MSAIIDAIENVIYGDPCAGEEPVDQTHRVVATNIEGKSVQEKVEKAQVVILLENHTEKDIHHLNGRVIRKLSHKGETVLFEKICPDYLPYSLRSSSKSWDLPSSKEVQELFSHWQTILYDVAFVIPTYLSLLIGATTETLNEGDEGMQILLKDFYPLTWGKKFEAYVGMNKEQRISFLKEMARECMTRLQQFDRDFETLLHKEFYQRNVHLVDTTEETLKKCSKVWVIAGEAHGRYVGSDVIKGVDYLYQSLQAKNVHYVTLKWFHPTLDADQYSNDRSKASFREEERIRTIAQSKQSEREEFFKDIPADMNVHLQNYRFNFAIEDITKNIPMVTASDYGQWILERAITWG